jgi:hypothetical protein
VAAPLPSPALRSESVRHPARSFELSRPCQLSLQFRVFSPFGRRRPRCIGLTRSRAPNAQCFRYLKYTPRARSHAFASCPASPQMPVGNGIRILVIFRTSFGETVPPPSCESPIRSSSVTRVAPWHRRSKLAPTCCILRRHVVKPAFNIVFHLDITFDNWLRLEPVHTDLGFLCSQHALRVCSLPAAGPAPPPDPPINQPQVSTALIPSPFVLSYFRALRDPSSALDGRGVETTSIPPRSPPSTN